MGCKFCLPVCVQLCFAASQSNQSQLAFPFSLSGLQSPCSLTTVCALVPRHLCSNLAVRIPSLLPQQAMPESSRGCPFSFRSLIREVLLDQTAKVASASLRPGQSARSTEGARASAYQLCQPGLEPYNSASCLGSHSGPGVHPFQRSCQSTGQSPPLLALHTEQTACPAQPLSMYA